VLLASLHSAAGFTVFESIIAVACIQTKAGILAVAGVL
jgi:hypothetical protein